MWKMDSDELSIRLRKKVAERILKDSLLSGGGALEIFMAEKIICSICSPHKKHQSELRTRDVIANVRKSYDFFAAASNTFFQIVLCSSFDSA